MFHLGQDGRDDRIEAQAETWQAEIDEVGHADCRQCSDRLAIGSVVDFVDVYWRTYHFWAFNVADSAITVGVCIMILDMLGVSQYASKAV